MSTIRPARTETYEHTVSGLLSKRAEIVREADVASYRVAELANDLAAVDRVLSLLGYQGDADAVTPRHQRKRAFGRGVLTRRAFETLRKADGPLSGREVAVAIIEAEGAGRGRSGVRARDNRQRGADAAQAARPRACAGDQG